MKAVKKGAAILLVLLTLCTLCGFPSSSAEEEVVGRPAVISAGAVNVREQPSDTSQRIGGLTLGKEVFVRGKTLVDGKYWYRIDYQNDVGYILGTTAYLVWDIGMANEDSVRVLVSSKSSSLAWGSLDRGDGVYILSKTTENDGSEWYQVYYDGHTGYVLTYQLSIMALPTRAQNAKYKQNVTLQTTAYNVPKGYTLVAGSGKTVSDGADKLCVYTPVGQLTDSITVPIAVYDGSGRLKAETEVTVPVNNGFFAKLMAVFGFIFSFFRWTKQIVEIS